MGSYGDWEWEWLNERPTGVLLGGVHRQTEYGPADEFIRRGDGEHFLRFWLNRDGQNEMKWARAWRVTPADTPERKP